MVPYDDYDSYALSDRDDGVRVWWPCFEGETPSAASVEPAQVERVTLLDLKHARLAHSGHKLDA